MKYAILYARVSSRDQEREGYSIPAQLKLLRQYAFSHNLQIIKEFVDVETAKTTGRTQFGEMVRFFEKNPDCRTVIAEKTDRLNRNFRDSLTLEDIRNAHNSSAGESDEPKFATLFTTKLGSAVRR